MKILSLLGEIVMNGVVVERKTFSADGNTIPVVYIHKGERSIYVPVVLTKESLTKWDEDGRVLITRGSFESYDNRKFFLRESGMLSAHESNKGTLLFARGIFLQNGGTIDMTTDGKLSMRDEKFRGFPWLHLRDDHTSHVDIGTIHFATSKTVVINGEDVVMTAQQYNFVVELRKYDSIEISLTPLKREHIVNVLRDGNTSKLSDSRSYQDVNIKL